MNKIIYSLVYNRKKSLNKRGVALVQVEAYLNRKKKYFSTKVYLRPDQWDAKKLLVKNHPNADALNRLIYEFMAMIEKNVTFSDLTFEFVSSFEYFLQSKGYHTNTIAKHMKHLKRHINVAINKEYMDIQKYAFRKYKIKTVENGHTHLAPEELEKMKTLQLTGRYIKYQKTLDAFLFCCYAGMRYSDFVNMKPENIVEMHQETWLIYKSIKTGTEVRLPLYLLFNGKGIQILNKYQANLQDFFHLRDNSNVNKELIIITRLAGLSKKVSFHTARHTNATLLIYNGVNITTVQKLLGHKSVKTTQIYTNVMDMTIISDLEKNHSLAHRKKGK